MDYNAEMLELLQKIEDNVEKMAKKENELERFVYETSDRHEFLYAFHGLDFLLALWDLDQWLREQIKYSQDYNEDVKDGFTLAREQLYDILREKDLSLDMLR